MGIFQGDMGISKILKKYVIFPNFLGGKG